MLRVFTAFSGYDSQCMALDRIGIDYDLVGWSEIDKFAIRAHDAVYPQYADRNFGDITEINPNALPDFDLMTYSSPCQDFSIAGRQRGGEKGSGTRSSLLWYCEEIIRVKRPRFLVMENVKNLVSEKFRPLFLEWERTLSSIGYTNFTEVLNAKDYSVPQNRERVFCVSVLNGWYEFPHREVLRKCLRDVLEEEVAAKYFLSEKMIMLLLTRLNENRIKRCVHVSPPRTGTDIARCLRANGSLCPTDNVIALSNGKLRRLTPRECFRLMGVSEQDIDAIQAAGISDSQQYKMAGNSIVVGVLAKIFQQLFRFNRI
jgi:DNA (cytosine-5)-methyltransferase 1|nr:MAG TPA: Cytosine specific methyltransferase [Caudoviricetes sp.]